MEYNKYYIQKIKDKTEQAAAVWTPTGDQMIKPGIIGHDMQKLLGYDNHRSVLSKQEESTSKKCLQIT